MTAENNRLKAENAELRKERDFYCNQVIENGGRAQRAIDALNAENAKLRKEIEAAKHDLSLFSGELVASKCENAKLRKLVKEMRVCLEDECKRCHEWGDACDLEHQMRELGIEVDG